MTIKTGQVVQQSTAGTAQSGNSKTLFSPLRPSRVSLVFSVTNDGFFLHGAGITGSAKFIVELIVAGAQQDLVLNGKTQMLDKDNVILEISMPGNYRLRVDGAQDSGFATVEGTPRSNWS